MKGIHIQSAVVNHMESKKLFYWLAVLLGFAAVALPSNVFDDVSTGRFYFYWMLAIKGIFAGGEFTSELEEGDVYIGSIIGAVLLVAGSVTLVILLLAAKKGYPRLAWLPALLLAGGMATFTIWSIVAESTFRGNLFAFYATPFGMLAGFAACAFVILAMTIRANPKKSRAKKN